jgi:hypothetical protein
MSLRAMSALAASRRTHMLQLSLSRFVLVVSSLSIGCDIPAHDRESQASQVSSSITEVVAANKDADAKLHLLTRVFLADGTAFEFYEPTAGSILYSQVGNAGTPPLQVDGTKGPVAVFRSLQPNTQVPQALLDAEARGAGPRATRPAKVSSALHEGGAVGPAQTTGVQAIRSAVVTQVCGAPPTNNGFCDPAWFKTNACNVDTTFSSVGLDWQWCLMNWWNGAFEQDGSGESSGYGAVCASIGQVLMTLTATYGGGQWTVAQGTWRWARPGQGWCNSGPWCDFYYDQNIRYDISGSGAEFHFCGGFWDVD